MKHLIAIVKRARHGFRGRMGVRLAAVVAAALLAGATAGVLPAVIGQALGAISGSTSPHPPSGLGRWVAAIMPAAAWGIVLVTLVATVVSVGVSVFASRIATAFSAEVTAAVRIDMLERVLGASARDVATAGNAFAGPPKPPGNSPRPAPAAARPPGAGPQPPGVAKGRPPASGAAPAHSAAKGTEIVKLAITRESAMVSEFAVSVITGLPQSLSTLLILGGELLASGAWFAFGGGLVLFVVSRLLADRASKRVGEARRYMTGTDAAVFASLQEKLATTEDLRLWGARGEAVREFAATAHACSESRTRFAEALAVAGQIKSIFMAMSPLLIVVALKLSTRAYDAGEVAKLLLLVPLLMARLEALDALRAGLIERAPLLEATLSIMRLPRSPPRAADARHLSPAEVVGHVRFEGVSFTPPGAGRPIIDRVSLDVPAGSVIGVCGPSGSGKSTLVRLLLRLDDADAGTVSLDGVPVTRIEPDDLPRLFGVVRQTSQLLQKPVRDNLAVGLDPAPDDARMLEALRRVQLHDLARQDTPDRSLDTAYCQTPPNFSGGEVRRLLLARMLLSDAPVCVLDEPEAGLPSGTAEEILRTIVTLAQSGAPGPDGVPRPRTCIVVTHAPHLLPSSFNVVLDKGRVVAQGSHAELQASSEPYRALLSEALKGDDGARSLPA